jgi:hypothetical protein
MPWRSGTPCSQMPHDRRAHARWKLSSEEEFPLLRLTFSDWSATAMCEPACSTFFIMPITRCSAIRKMSGLARFGATSQSAPALHLTPRRDRAERPWRDTARPSRLPQSRPRSHRHSSARRRGSMALGFAVQSQELAMFLPRSNRAVCPIRFVFRNKLNGDDKLLVAFDARVFSEVLVLTRLDGDHSALGGSTLKS